MSNKGERGEPRVGFKLTDDGKYDIDTKKLTNVGEGVSSSDAVNKHQLTVGLNQKHDNTRKRKYMDIASLVTLI